MISRLRFMLEMSCCGSGDKTELPIFRPDLDASRIKAPALAAKRTENGRYEWAETDKEEKLPIKPEVIFKLTVSIDGRRHKMDEESCYTPSSVSALDVAGFPCTARAAYRR